MTSRIAVVLTLGVFGMLAAGCANPANTTTLPSMSIAERALPDAGKKRNGIFGPLVAAPRFMFLPGKIAEL